MYFAMKYETTVVIPLLRFERFSYGVAATNNEMMLFCLKLALQELSLIGQYFNAFCGDTDSGVIPFQVKKHISCVSPFGVHQPMTKFAHCLNLSFIIFTQSRLFLSTTLTVWEDNASLV